MTSCIDNEMEDREYCPLSPERILFLTTAKTLKTEKIRNGLGGGLGSKLTSVPIASVHVRT